jgi:hypothetical protein
MKSIQNERKKILSFQFINRDRMRLLLTPPPQWSVNAFKGIDRSFKLRGEIRLIPSVVTNWRLGNFFHLILNGLHHKISKKPKVAAL